MSNNSVPFLEREKSSGVCFATFFVLEHQDFVLETFFSIFPTKSTMAIPNIITDNVVKKKPQMTFECSTLLRLTSFTELGDNVE